MQDLLSISRQALTPEKEAVALLIARLAHLDDLEPRIKARSGELIGQLRAGPVGSVESFMHEYGLSSEEGVAVMCLAEALLRIPDAATADKLIQGTFDDANWKQHLGHSDSLLVNASSWGLLLTGKIVKLSGQDPVTRIAARLSEPVIREALKAGMRFIGSQFVLGETVKEALARSAPYGKKGFRFSYDVLGEGARTDAQAASYLASYSHAIREVGKEAKGKKLLEAPGISVKLSALHPRYQLVQQDRVMTELLPCLTSLALLAKEQNITLSIDAEEASRLDIELTLFTELYRNPALAGWNGLGFVVQAYQKRALAVIQYLADLAKAAGRVMPVRLVKGAYWDSEIKWAQMAGLSSYPVFTRKEHTDVSYLACADLLLKESPVFYPQFATHNARTAATIEALANYHGVAAGAFEFQRLHGMGEKLHSLLLTTHASRIYAPIGEHKDLLAYLIRRLLENGANSSFVNLLMDEDTPLETLLANPLDAARQTGGSPNPSIPLPADIYGTRKNSVGIDLGGLAALTELKHLLKPSVMFPLENTDASTIAVLLNQAKVAQPAWSEQGVSAHAAALEKTADLIEAEMPGFIALLMDEAGRTLADAIAEVREAADFCRYYAAEARRLKTSIPLTGPTGESNALTLHARGIFACISPWNFPLSIFTGQIAAALAMGNAVIAKPAEQTPRIAAKMAALFWQAGTPKAVLQLAIGTGETVGAALINEPGIDGVVFTGSFDTAKVINRSLANREGAIIPFIAETGGQNAMVVDSSALLEATCDDIILSAFGSAGQRCSSLRVLYVQEDIADALIALVAGAMQELCIGDAKAFSTDIGPVIDKPAQEALLAHIARMTKEAALLARTPLPANLPEGYFVAPHLFEVRDIHQIGGEHFGPMLHVIRFKAGDLKYVAEDINGTGFGLTFGMHSRIESHIAFFTSHIRAGNMYVNRGMTGAVVGVQPFGGEGLSGTGPKAGGPHYLLRFTTERALTVNTVSIGGNLELFGRKA